jgi:hypothetical protein
MTVTNQNLIQDEIKRRLSSSNACCNSVQNILSSRLLSKNLKSIIYAFIIFPEFLYGCEIWSLALWEEHRLKMVQKRGPRRIFGLKRNEVVGGWRNPHNKELHDLYSSPNTYGIIKSTRIGGRGMWREWGRRGLPVGYGKETRWKETTREIKM